MPPTPTACTNPLQIPYSGSPESLPPILPMISSPTLLAQTPQGPPALGSPNADVFQLQQFQKQEDLARGWIWPLVHALAIPFPLRASTSGVLTPQPPLQPLPHLFSQLHPHHHQTGPSPVAQVVKNLPTRQDTWVQSLGWKDPLDKGMANTLQYSCLENSMNRGTRQVTIPRVMKTGQD